MRPRAHRTARSGLAAAAVTSLTAAALAVPATSNAAPAAGVAERSSAVPAAAAVAAERTSATKQKSAAKQKAASSKKKARKGKPLQLTILHNNDGESQLLGAPADEDFGGIARFKTLTAQLKKEARTGRKADARGGLKRAAIMLSSGDNFLAGPEFNASLEKGVPFYDSLGLDAVGYDAMAIGNHEFDFGPDVLADFIRGFGETAEDRPPFVSANLDVSGEPALAELAEDGTIVERTVVTKRRQRIGVVGATTPALRSISSPRNVEVLQDVAAIVQRQIDQLTAEGVNKIILVSHLQSILEDQDLVAQLSGVDVAIAGGGDELLADEGDLLVPGDEISTGLDGEPLSYPQYSTGADGAEVPIVTTAGDYKYVGRLVVRFDRNGDVVRVGDSSGPVRVSGVGPDAVEPDPYVQRTVVEPVQDYVDQLAETVLAQSEVALEGRRAPGVRTEETNLGNLLADALLYAGQQNAAEYGVDSPQVALQNGGGIRNNSLIPPGELTELTTFDIAPFSNFVSVVPDIPSSQFKEILENAVSAPAAEDGTISSDGQFAQVAGFEFVYDLSGQAQEVNDAGEVLTSGTRVQSVTLDDGTPIVVDGEPVAGATVDVATNDFSARGGDQYPFRGADFTTVGLTYQQALAQYLTDGLGGVVSSAEYPEGGEGRITDVTP